MSLGRKNIKELLKLLEQRQISPLDIARDLLAGIAAGNSAINAFTGVEAAKLMVAAKKITEDNSFSSRPLGGIPLAIKDNICVKGSATTCASRMLQDYESPFDATVIRKLREAGALVLGKTNLDEFGMGSSTEKSIFGPSRNPWSLARTPGGSSGGSAAAVAAGLAPGALGSDTGGSIRQPAAFCGLVGMKPSYGTVSRYGLVAFASSLDQIGPLTRTVEDSALLFNVICGPDSNDAKTVAHSAAVDCTSLSAGFSGLKVGIPPEFESGQLDDAVENNFYQVIDRLASEHVQVVRVALPHLNYALPCYYIIANAEASANLARYDGLRYGHRAALENNVQELVNRSRGEGFGEEVQRRILTGTFVLSEGYIDAYYRKALQIRSLIRQDFKAAFSACDLILLPTSPTPAFKLGERLSRPLDMYRSDILTVPASLAGLPAISVPSGITPERLPLGIQVIGGRFEEAKMFQAAYGLEQLVDFKVRPPELVPGAES